MEQIGYMISIHALREEGDRKPDGPDRYVAADFYPRPPRGGRPHRAGNVHRCRIDFYPRPPRGGRPRCRSGHTPKSDFYPRPPRGGRPGFKNRLDPFFGFLSTPSARRATRFALLAAPAGTISIHALREEGDSWQTSFYWRQARFLSTPSARRAT